MRCRTLVALLAVVTAPAGALAEDSWVDDRPPGYDVSVDLNVQGAVTFDTFQGPLQPYGDWVVVGSYGQVWRPRVVAGWRPYYYGRWEWTNEGWFWVSDEPWGWAVYHYGRWAYDPYYGWIWVPGYEWAPAWVSWRASGDVIGWAPLAPGFSVYVSTYPFIDFWWTFVPCVRFVSVPVYTVAYAPGHTRRWFYATAPAPARPVPQRGLAPAPAWGGPAPRLIEQRIGRPIAPARIVRAPSPGGRSRPGEVLVYRPERRDDGAPGRALAGERSRPAPPAGGRGPGAVPAPGWSGDRGQGDGGRASGAFRPEPQRGGPPAGSAGGEARGARGGGGEPERGARGGGGEPERGARGGGREPERGARGGGEPERGVRGGGREPERGAAQGGGRGMRPEPRGRGR